MKATTKLMRRAMSVAVVVLRERLRWSQIRLAAEMNKWVARKGCAGHRYGWRPR